MSVKLKICGLRRVEDIRIINETLPTYAGFVFAQSKRQIDLNTALILKEQLDQRIQTVGVFVDSTIENIVNIVASGAINLIQLHGNENQQYISQLRERVNIEIIKALRVNNSTIYDFKSASYLLLDSGGGSGKTFDWTSVPKLKKPFFLAGGISIDNMSEAIESFNPYALDISSSVETNGFKDYQKILEFSNKLKKLNGEYDE
ncbi:MAG: phosphoribosylanthranilate isomerase [Spirochaetaceae bacterium]|nr:phosphoribosylanthranilate isomerase [Spirochaetaceae bacterium]